MKPPRRSFSLPGSALALIPGLTDRVTQNSTCQTGSGANIDVVNCTISAFEGRLLPIVFSIITGLALILLIVAGIQYILASGNADATKKARQRIVNIFLAIVILVAAYGIINLIITLATFAGNLGK